MMAVAVYLSERASEKYNIYSDLSKNNAEKLCGQDQYEVHQTTINSITFIGYLFPNLNIMLTL